jgi:hypothetical protein
VSGSDPLIRVVVDDPVFAVPERVVFNSALSTEARLVACLWFARRRQPSSEEVEQVLGFPRHMADVYLAELAHNPSMRGVL